MIATFVADELTPLTWQRAAEVMRWALDYPSDQIVALALAKCALETGRWTKCHVHNWGNVKAGGAYVGMYTCFPCNEVLVRDGKRVVVWFDPVGERGQPPSWLVPPGHPQTRFRAYANEYDGANEYCKTLARNFLRSWAALRSGATPETFVSTLKIEKYFTADEEQYVRAVKSLHNEFVAKLSGLPWATDLEQDHDWDMLRALVVANRFDDIGIIHSESLRDLGEEDTSPGIPGNGNNA